MPSHQQRLASFFRYYEPTQLRIIDQWLENWRGREQELFAELVRFHGPEPSAHHRLTAPPVVRSIGAAQEAACRDLLQQTLLLYAPERVDEAPSILAEWDGQHTELLRRLRRQVALRDHVLRLVKEHFPERASEVPALLRQWLGRELELIQLLARDRTSFPARPPPQSSASTHQAAALKEDRAPLPFTSYRDQLIHFYRLYKPERLDDVDAILESYAGREPELFRKLYRKYCKEPEEDTKHGARSDQDTNGAAATTATAATPANSRSAIRHLVAGSNFVATVELEEFVRDFQGTDTELAWALRTFARNGGGETPPSKVATRETIAAQIAQLERAVRDRQEVEAAVHEDASPQSSPKIVSPAVSRDHRVHSMSVVLEPLGISHLAGQFVAEDVTVDLLPQLTAADLRGLGIEPAEERARILRALSRLA